MAAAPCAPCARRPRCVRPRIGRYAGWPSARRYWRPAPAPKKRCCHQRAPIHGRANAPQSRGAGKGDRHAGVAGDPHPSSLPLLQLRGSDADASFTFGMRQSCVADSDCGGSGRFCYLEEAGTGGGPAQLASLASTCASCWQCCLFPEAFGSCPRSCGCQPGRACYSSDTCGPGGFSASQLGPHLWSHAVPSYLAPAYQRSSRGSRIQLLQDNARDSAALNTTTTTTTPAPQASSAA
jgi:hypothetical protein